MGPELIAANLRRLREEHGLTQAELAEAAGLSRLAYRNIETRRSVPRADTLYALANALSVGVEALVSATPHLEHVRFRSRKRLNSREQVLAEVARTLVDFNELEGMLSEKKKPKTIRPPARKSGLERARALAPLVRHDFGIGDKEPIRNICGLMEKHGYKVLLVNVATDGFFGLSVVAQDGGPAVVVNNWERISVERRIFTAAHELGHLLLHLSAFDIDEPDENDDEEKEADAFAAHFLMPDAIFEAEWDETSGLPFVPRVLKVKRMFRVSYKTVLHRLAGRNPGTNYYAKFNADYRRTYGHSLPYRDEPEGLGEDAFNAPEPLKAGEPDNLSPADFEEDRLFALVRKAVERELITLSRAGEILGKSTSQMRELSSSWVN